MSFLHLPKIKSTRHKPGSADLQGEHTYIVPPLSMREEIVRGGADLASAMSQYETVHFLSIERQRYSLASQ